MELAADVPLPMRFEKIYNGYDVVILEHSAAQMHQNAINIPGRNALVSPDLKAAIQAKFPSMFKTLDQVEPKVTILG